MKHFLFILALLFCVFSLEAQQGINYQIVVRDASGEILSSKSVDFDVKIFDGNNAVFTESHSISSSTHGVCQFIIGSKDSAAFHNIDWSKDLIIDIEAFNKGVSLGKSNSGFQYVPYGLYAEKAGAVDSIYYGDVKFGDSNFVWVTQEDAANWNDKIDSARFVVLKDSFDNLKNHVDTLVLVDSFDLKNWNGKLDKDIFDNHEANKFIEGDKDRYDSKLDSLDSLLIIAETTVWVDSAKAKRWSVKLDSNAFDDLQAVGKINSDDVQSWNGKATTASVDTKVDKRSFVKLDAVTSIDSSKITEWDNKVTISELNQKVDKSSIQDLLTIGTINSIDVSNWNSKVDSSSFIDLKTVGTIDSQKVASWDATYDSLLNTIKDDLLAKGERDKWDGKLDKAYFESHEASKFVEGDKDSLSWVIEKVKEIDSDPTVILASDIANWNGKLDSASFFRTEASQFTSGDKAIYDEATTNLDSLLVVSTDVVWVDSSKAKSWDEKLDVSIFNNHEASKLVSGDKAKLDQTNKKVVEIDARLTGKVLITTADSIYWANKIDSSSFNDLGAIGAIYQSDIDQWNNKLDSSFTHISFQLDSNDVNKIRNLVAADTIQDSVITAEDIAYWNAKVDKVAFTDLSAVTGITSAKITTWNNNVTKVTNLENDVYTAGVGSDVKWKNKLDASIYNNSEAKRFQNGDKANLDQIVGDTAKWNAKLDKSVYDAAPASGIKATDITKWNTDDTQISSPNSNSKVEVSNNNAVIFTNGIERLRVQSDGDVGIGMNNPTQKLEVNGNVKTNKVIAENGIQFGDNTTLTSANLVGLNLSAADTARWANHMDSASFPYLANNRKITNADLNTWNGYNKLISDNEDAIVVNKNDINKNTSEIKANATQINSNKTSITSLNSSKLNTSTFNNSVAGKIKQADVNNWNGYQNTLNIANQGEDSISNSIGNTSIKTSANNVVTIRTNDVERLTVLKNGNVGIGTSAPLNNFDLKGNLVVGNSYAGVKSAPINGVLIEGNVGIGTDTPASRLEVTAAAGQAAITVNRTTSSSIEGGQNWLILDGNKVANGKLGLNFYSAGDVVVANGGGNVGIGTAAPSARLQIHTTSNTLANPTMLLHETVANNGVRLSFSNGAVNKDWVLFGMPQATTSSAVFNFYYEGSNKNIISLKGDGKVLIDDLKGTGNRAVAVNASGQLYTTDIVNVTAGNGLSDPDPSANVVLNVNADNGLVAKADYVKLGGSLNEETTISMGAFPLVYNLNGTGDFFINDGNANRFAVLHDGNVGVGTAAPHALLHLVNGGNNRKIVLQESSNNAHQFYGFGINTSMLRYQIANTSASHVFYAAISATASNELFRINGDGKVGINTEVPEAMMHISANGGKGLVVYDADWNQFEGSFMVKHGTGNLNQDFDGFYLQNDGSNKSTWGIHVNNDGGKMILGFGDDSNGKDSKENITEKFTFQTNGSLNFKCPNNDNVIRFGTVDSESKFGGIRTNGGNSGDKPSFYSSSDLRIKKNVNNALPILDKIMSLEIVEYDFINGGHADYGVVAQQLNEIFPNKVAKTDDGVSPLKDSSAIWTVSIDYQYELIKATQEQQYIIDEQARELEIIKAQLAQSTKIEQEQKAENNTQQAVIDAQQQQLESLELQLEEIRRHLGMDAKAKLD